MSKGCSKEQVGISALDCRTSDLIKEVSHDALNFYVHELDSLYLPEDFIAEHGEVFDVVHWSKQNRLKGKFGRFVVNLENETKQDILLMGATVGVDMIGPDGCLQSLRHFELRHELEHVLHKRGFGNQDYDVDREDYGSTKIETDSSGKPKLIIVGGRSIDYGRANEVGRGETCRQFSKILGSDVVVINSDPVPLDYEYVIGGR